jgi:hypothetical protein
MLEILNAGALDKQLEQWEEAVYELVRQVAIGYTVELYKAVLSNSAQYSGDYCANWNLSFGDPDFTVKTNIFSNRDSGSITELVQNGTKVQGHNEAISYGMRKLKSVKGRFKLGETIFISNASYHEEPYAAKIEGNLIKFRPGNYGNTVGRSLDRVRQYTDIGPDDLRKLTRNKYDFN